MQTIFDINEKIFQQIPEMIDIMVRLDLYPGQFEQKKMLQVTADYDHLDIPDHAYGSLFQSACYHVIYMGKTWDILTLENNNMYVFYDRKPFLRKLTMLGSTVYELPIDTILYNESLIYPFLEEPHSMDTIIPPDADYQHSKQSMGELFTKIIDDIQNYIMYQVNITKDVSHKGKLYQFGQIAVLGTNIQQLEKQTITDLKSKKAQWEVKPHVRHLKNGTVVYIKGHTRKNRHIKR